MSTAPVERMPFIDAVLDRLDDLPDATGHIEEPKDLPKLDAAGHVQRYWVLHPFFGNPSLEQDLAETNVDLEWTFQITVAAAWKRDCFALAQLIDARLHRWAPTVADYRAGDLLPPFGYDPGTPRLDRDVTPSRWSLPLQYRTRIARQHDPA